MLKANLGGARRIRRSGHQTVWTTRGLAWARLIVGGVQLARGLPDCFRTRPQLTSAAQQSPRDISQAHPSARLAWVTFRATRKGNTSPKAATPKSCLASCLAACVLPCVCRSGLACKAFDNQVRLDFPRKRSRHEGVQDAVEPAWNDFGAVFEQTAEALKYALLDAHRFHRHGLRIEAELFEHRCVRKPGCQYSDVDT